MAKMFYTTEEAAGKLGVSADQLKDYIAQNKLREFRDGARVMFKVDQVDKIASEAKAGTKSGGAGASGTSLDLTPMDSHGGTDALSLADSSPGRAAKEDTVVTGGGSKAGSSSGSKSGSRSGKPMFESGEIKMADTGAQTTIQPAVEDQLSLEGVGSGSGLLDLTRESDDTSLGAELLDEIYPGGEHKDSGQIGSASGIFEQPTIMESTAGGPAIAHAEPAAPVMHAPTEYAEQADPGSGLFGGVALASTCILVLGIVALAGAYIGVTPGWLESISGDTTKVGIFAGVCVAVTLLFALGGFFVGKATAR
jgi:excisionase family DNA binding protein